MVSGRLLDGCAGSNFSSLMNFCASGFMLAMIGAGCPAATTATSIDLSVISLTSAWSLGR